MIDKENTKENELTKLKIYLLSSFDSESMCGKIRYYLLCNGVLIKNEYTESLATREVRAEIYSLYKALQFINKQCNIEIITRMPDLFEENNYKKSLDKDLLHNINVISHNMKHEITLTKMTDKHLDMIISLENKYKSFDENWRDSREVEKGIKRKVESAKKVYTDLNINTNKNNMYADLDDVPGQRAWVPGSGGY